MLKIIVLHTPVSPKFLTTVNVMLNPKLFAVYVL